METFWYRLTDVHLQKWPVKWSESVCYGVHRLTTDMQAAVLAVQSSLSVRCFRPAAQQPPPRARRTAL